MRQLAALLVLVAIGAWAFLWFEENVSACRIPHAYRIGTIDEGFGITREDARKAVAKAEAMWEELTGKDLFVYDEAADFTVNFVFDTRQQLTNEEHEFRDILEQKEGLSEAIKAEYEALAAQYGSLKERYELRLSAYEADLAAYNDEVAMWNERGGAPEETYERLNADRRALNAESRELARIARELNNLVAQINNLGEEGNRVVEDYNEDVAQYNDRFNHEYEFTQGDYQGERINIYQFDSEQELITVLAHEFGHALRLEHVEDQNAIMYYLMDIENHRGNLTIHDLNEFNRVCGKE